MVLMDALGTLVRFVLRPGQRHDTIDVAPLINGITSDALLGDKGFNYDHLRAELDQCNAQAVIPLTANRRTAVPCDFAMYRWRHLIENVFCNLKQNRRIATRYDRTTQSFAASINVAAVGLALR